MKHISTLSTFNSKWYDCQNRGKSHCIAKKDGKNCKFTKSMKFVLVIQLVYVFFGVANLIIICAAVKCELYYQEDEDV